MVLTHASATMTANPGVPVGHDPGLGSTGLYSRIRRISAGVRLAVLEDPLARIHQDVPHTARPPSTSEAICGNSARRPGFEDVVEVPQLTQPVRSVRSMMLAPTAYSR